MFDPRPNIIYAKGDRPIFPGFDPIYNYKTKEELLEYVYTTVYPTKSIPSFPNFVVNGHVIDGEVYNPLYDYRNYRLFGDYSSEETRVRGYDLFDSKPVNEVKKKMSRGRYFTFTHVWVQPLV